MRQKSFTHCDAARDIKGLSGRLGEQSNDSSLPFDQLPISNALRKAQNKATLLPTSRFRSVVNICAEAMRELAIVFGLECQTHPGYSLPEVNSMSLKVPK